MILTEEDLVRWGRLIGEDVRPPVFIALHGPLGAGKSVLARAMARGAGVEGPVPSPTFNLCFRYPAGRGREVVHLDLYRLETVAELRELGWEELGSDGEFVVVEWAEKAGPLLPPDRWEVELAPLADRPQHRLLRVRRVGAPPELPAPLAAPST